MSSILSRSCVSDGAVLIDVEFDWVHEHGTLTLTTGALRLVPREPLARDLHNLPSVGYLRAESPSEFWEFPHIADTVTHSLAGFFAALLPKDKRIEHVYWFSEDDVLKVWTVIPEPDFEIQEPVYQAQMDFMEKFPEYECDFSVIFRFNRPFDDVKPHGAHSVL